MGHKLSMLLSYLTLARAPGVAADLVSPTESALGERRPNADAQPTPEPTDAEPAPSRFNAGAAVTPLLPPLQVRPIKDHVAAIVGGLHEHFSPGDVLEHEDMQDFYAFVCEHDRLVPRPWNPLAKELRGVMGKGPRGSSKPYGWLLRADGSRERVRIWIVPDRVAAVVEPVRTPWQRFQAEHGGQLVAAAA